MQHMCGHWPFPLAISNFSHILRCITNVEIHAIKLINVAHEGDCVQKWRPTTPTCAFDCFDVAVQLLQCKYFSAIVAA